MASIAPITDAILNTSTAVVVNPADAPFGPTSGCFRHSNVPSYESGPCWPYSYEFAYFHTPATCQAHCVGYRYFGIFESWRCWCGNDIPELPRVDFDAHCNSPCKADSDQLGCGGDEYLAVYQMINYLGCFGAEDNMIALSNDVDVDDESRNSTNSAAFPSPTIEKYVLEANYTPSLCRRYCAEYRYFGVQNGGDCYCSDDRENLGLPDEAQPLSSSTQYCNITKPDISGEAYEERFPCIESETLGGLTHMDVFENDPAWMLDWREDFFEVKWNDEPWFCPSEYREKVGEKDYLVGEIYLPESSGHGSVERAKKERKATVIVPKFFALASLLGSGFIVYGLVKDRQKQLRIAFNRLLLGLSVFDMVSSVGFFLGTWALPNEAPPITYDYSHGIIYDFPDGVRINSSGLLPKSFGCWFMDYYDFYWPFASGTQWTCTIQGMMIHIGLVGSVLMTATLAVTCLLTVKYDWREMRLRKVEKYMYPVILVFPTASAIAFGSLGYMNPTPGGYCWVGSYPWRNFYFFEDFNDGDGVRGMNHIDLLRAIFGVAWVGVAILVCLFSMIAVYFYVRGREKTSRRWSMQASKKSPSLVVARKAMGYIGILVVVYVPVASLMFGISGTAWFTDVTLTSLLASVGMFNVLVYGGAYEKVVARFKAFRSSHNGSSFGNWVSRSFRRRPSSSRRGHSWTRRNRNIPSEEPERYADFNGDDENDNDAMLENQSSFFFKTDVVPNRDLEKDQVVVFGNEDKEGHSHDAHDADGSSIAMVDVEAGEDDLMANMEMAELDDVNSELAEEDGAEALATVADVDAEIVTSESSVQESENGDDNAVEGCAGDTVVEEETFSQTVDHDLILAKNSATNESSDDAGNGKPAQEAPLEGGESDDIQASK